MPTCLKRSLEKDFVPNEITHVAHGVSVASYSPIDFR